MACRWQRVWRRELVPGRGNPTIRGSCEVRGLDDGPPVMRPLAWLAVVLMAIAWISLPSNDPAAVAVQRIPELFQAPIEGGESSLADLLLDGIGTAPEVEGSKALDPAPLRVALAGVRMVVPGKGSVDLTIHGRARRALVSALRQAAQARGQELKLDGEWRSVEGGWNVLVTLRNQQLSANVRAAPGSNAAAAIPAPPSDRRALLPALVAIAMALLWRRPLIALFSGLAVGAGLLFAANHPATTETWDGYPGDFVRMLFTEATDTHAWQPLATLLALLATWAVTARNGGLGGWTAWFSARSTSARRAQLVAWLGALCLFFEAPQKHIVLGWTLRTFLVRSRVSAEKFAWILDSTATAVLGLCALSPLTAFAFSFAATQSNTGSSAGELWLATLPWRSFCWLTLGLSFLVIQSGRDFSSMLAAERRSREGLGPNASGARRVFAAPEPDPRTAVHAWRAIAPIMTFGLVLLVQTLRAGAANFAWSSPSTWLELGASAADPSAAWIAALAALLVALALSAIGGAERGVPAAFAYGLRAAMRPCLLLFAAWALAVVSSRLGAGEVLAAFLGNSLAPQTLPAALFVIAAAASFIFGSAAAMLPLLLTLACGLAGELGADFAAGPASLSAISLAAVLEGSLAGALLSPLSFSSLSASIAAGADHLDHMRTQAPYVLLTTLCVFLFGFLPAGLFGIGPWSALLLAAVAHLAVFAWVSRASERRADLPT